MSSRNRNGGRGEMGTGKPPWLTGGTGRPSIGRGGDRGGRGQKGSLAMDRWGLKRDHTAHPQGRTDCVEKGKGGEATA